MDRPIYHFFTADHKRIEGLLEKAIENPDEINLDYYHQFRTGLLTHIKMEEKTLFPAAALGNGGQPLPLAAKLRLDHGALTALMTVPPTMETIKVTKQILDIHDRLEEEEGGMYEMCEKLTAEQTEEIMDKLSKVTEVPVHPFNTHPVVFGAMKRALERAGFDYDELIKN
ncbi:MAG: hemerythrin domain-containing protein [Flavobacteriia bacterium]|nr:hemerythrin domain-containing protein [Flavobacteriia bacterium]